MAKAKAKPRAKPRAKAKGDTAIHGVDDSFRLQVRLVNNELRLQQTLNTRSAIVGRDVAVVNRYKRLVSRYVRLRNRLSRAGRALAVWRKQKKRVRELLFNSVNGADNGVVPELRDEDLEWSLVWSPSSSE